MADWPLLAGGGPWPSGGAVLASSGGTSVTTGAANVKGSFATLVASTASASDAIMVSLSTASSTRSHLVDIAIGAAAAEVVIIPNLLIATLGNDTALFLFPVRIPAGVRISARAQSTAASAVVTVSVNLTSDGFALSSPLGRVTAYGTATASSGGISTDPGGTANTKGAWAELTASTTYPTRSVIMAYSNQANGTRTSGKHLFDLAIGASGSEIVVLGDLRVDQSTLSVFPRCTPPLPLTLPAGVRFAARQQSTVTDATDRLVDVAVYGVD